MRRRSHRTKPRPEMHSRIEHVKGPVYKGLGNYVTPNGSNALTSTVSRLFRAKSFKHELRMPSFVTTACVYPYASCQWFLLS